jgi:hypothetical protein
VEFGSGDADPESSDPHSPQLLILLRHLTGATHHPANAQDVLQGLPVLQQLGAKPLVQGPDFFLGGKGQFN